MHFCLACPLRPEQSAGGGAGSGELEKRKEANGRRAGKQRVGRLFCRYICSDVGWVVGRLAGWGWLPGCLVG